MAEFNVILSELDGIAAEFNDRADFFEQRLRQLGQEACENTQVKFALSTSKGAMDDYTSSLSGLFGVYGELLVAQASNPERSLADIDNGFIVATDREAAIQGRYARMLGEFGLYECDDEDAEVDEDADEETDPDDADLVEKCGDGLDNDKDGEIDECDAGCCNKNAQITVTDCGAASDDIFEVSLDGAKIGLTPKGSANTWNRELEPGPHTVTIVCLDDGGDPLGSDVGTACVNVVVYGTNVALGGGAPSIPYGGSATISFEVPEGPAAANLQRLYDGAVHRARGLE